MSELKSTITRESLARAIKRETGLNMNITSQFVEEAIEIIAKQLLAQKSVTIRMFGTFYTKRKNARIGRNPKTMEEATISEREVIKFKVAPTLKKRINDYINYLSANSL